MAKIEYLASESVTEGHPDKICDQISDAVLDAFLRQDPKSRVACESFICGNNLVIGGEITSKGKVDVENLARSVIKNIGYDDKEKGLDYRTVKITTMLNKQSPDIAMGVSKDDPLEQGAGDQGCIKKGTLVRTNKGFVPIEDVKVGNLVATPYGYKKVLVARQTGRKNIVEVKFSNGMSVECTADHRILCYDRKGQTYWKEASRIKSGDFICALKPQNEFSRGFTESNESKRKFFGKYNHKIFGPEKIILDSRVGYLTGELIGDGYVVKPKEMQIAFGNNRQHAVAVQEIATSIMPKWRFLEDKQGNVSLKIDSILVRKHFENFGLLYHKAPRKVTPRAIFTSPLEVIKAYVRGLFDSDGTIVIDTGRNKKNIRIRLCSSSFRLLQEVQLLLNDFGIKSSILFNRPKGTLVGKDKRYASKYDNYVLSLVGFESYQKFGQEIGFFDKIKQQKLIDYLRENQIKPKNSKGIFLVPHSSKNEMIDESHLRKSLPFAVAICREVIDKNEIADVYDLEIEDVNMFSAGGVFVHNSMFGFATGETPVLMPMGIYLAHNLAKRLSKVRKNLRVPFLRPDGKTQVTVEYRDNIPHHLHNILISTQHDPDVSNETLRKALIEKVIKPVVPKNLIDKKTEIFVNPTGRFVIGGPAGDTGLTGRKIIVDTYGGLAKHGGGAFSGKDPSKVDRSAAYAMRWAAKNMVAAGLAKKAEIKVAYAIGMSRPLAFNVNTFGTGKLSDNKLADLVSKVFDFRPAAIIKELNLLRPIYLQTAAYGHFGRTDIDLPWEKCDKVKQLSTAYPPALIA